MKKVLAKLPLPRKKTETPAGRITSDTLAEHREQVLAGGRRFKYPVQYARHRLVINAILISVGALIILGAIGWWQLYPSQNTSDFMYRVSKVFSLPVAEVDGQKVAYSDYLMRYRSSVQYLLERDQADLSSEEGQRRADAIKRRELDGAIADAYAFKLARELDISVPDAELEQFLLEQRQSADGEVTEATYNAVILDYYGWSPEEYSHAMKSKLVRQKVSYAIDKEAEARAETVSKLVKAGEADITKLVAALNTGGQSVAMQAPPVWVPKNNQDGGLAQVAAKLEKGKISAPIKIAKGTGYYFVKLVEISETQVRYELIHIPLGEFEARLEKVKKDGGVKEYIDVIRTETE